MVIAKNGIKINWNLEESFFSPDWTIIGLFDSSVLKGSLGQGESLYGYSLVIGHRGKEKTRGYFQIVLKKVPEGKNSLVTFFSAHPVYAVGNTLLYLKKTSLFSRKKGKIDYNSNEVLVAFEKISVLLKFLELENHLSDLLGIYVDLVRKEAIREELKETILKDTVTL